MKTFLDLIIVFGFLLGFDAKMFEYVKNETQIILINSTQTIAYLSPEVLERYKSECLTKSIRL
jgi:hypothetical protein